jgi:hypothetical protein
MTWTMDDRHAFVELLPELGSSADSDEILEFLKARQEAIVSEAGAVPGIDQVRAGILRALRLANHALLPEAITAARAALAVFPEQIIGAAPALMQRRHPAWVGLCALEAGLSPDIALAYAKAGFEAFAGPQGDGDVFWAMAEAAEDVGWNQRHFELLDLARSAPFLDDEPRAQVVLLWALHAVDTDPTAVGDLILLADDAEAPDRVRIHANWVLAMRAQEAGRAADARMHLVAALALVDADNEPDVAEKLRAALR